MKHEMPRYYTGKRWAPVSGRSIPVRDIKRPCAICGWSEHMAIHSVPAGTDDPIGPIGLHSYQATKEPSK